MRTKQVVRHNVPQNEIGLQRCNAMTNIFAGMAGYEHLAPVPIATLKDTKLITDRLSNKEILSNNNANHRSSYILLS